MQHLSLLVLLLSCVTLELLASFSRRPRNLSLATFSHGFFKRFFWASAAVVVGGDVLVAAVVIFFVARKTVREKEKLVGQSQHVDVNAGAVAGVAVNADVVVATTPALSKRSCSSSSKGKTKATVWKRKFCLPTWGQTPTRAHTHTHSP